MDFYIATYKRQYYEDGEWLLWNYYSFMEDMPSDFRKATVKEIIEHFSK